MALTGQSGSGPSTYSVGLHNVGSYQVSAVPWISGSGLNHGKGAEAALPKGQEFKFEFPMVAKTITVINQSAQDIRVHFNSTSSTLNRPDEQPIGGINVISGSHYLLLNSAEDSYTFGVKATEIFVSAPETNSGDASFTIVAELTQINLARMFELSGSGLTE